MLKFDTMELNVVTVIGLILIGVMAGIISGLVGIGGGIVIVPALVFIFGFSQHMSQGTTLALMVPPIGLLAAWQYYKQGYVDIKIAALVAVGFIVGGYFGGKLAVTFSEQVLKRVFAVVLILIAVRMLFAAR
jgi:hypothetical protein